MSQFFQQLEQRRIERSTLLCLGLDTDPEKIPQILANDADPMFRFNQEVMDATHDLVACYKPQIAY